MQAGRPYKDRLFPSGQFHYAIAPFLPFLSILFPPFGKGRVKEG